MQGAGGPGAEIVGPSSGAAWAPVVKLRARLEERCAMRGE